MARPRLRYVCQACGAVQPRWLGQCPDCGAWNSLRPETRPRPHARRAADAPPAFRSLAEAVALPGRLATGLGEFDRTLGGGLVPGSAVLLGGDPGIGKSTLLLQVAARLARQGRRVAYVSGEELVAQVQLRARRLGLADAPVELAAATAVREVLAALAERPALDLLVVDSIQTMHVDTQEGAPGTVGQVRELAFALIGHAKTSGAALVLVGHVTKDGQLAGPRVLEHMVDVVLSFEGERTHAFRILRAAKNRFGATDEIGVFAMGPQGLEEVGNPSALFLARHERPVPGAVVFPALEGTRPLLVEIEALTVPVPTGATPRRAVVGWDAGRLSMLLAVLEARAGVGFGAHEVYLGVAGGLRVGEPAADLAVAAALLSARSDVPLPAGAVAFGEVALSGEVRRVPHADLRLKEAARLGFTLAFTPPEIADTTGLRIEAMATLADLVRRIGRSRGR